MIEIENLVKTYKGLDEAVLKSVCLTVKKGEIFGLLGPNGAGKTTLINILCGLKKFDSGKVFISDFDITKSPERLRNIIGVVPQEIALYPTLTATENLQFFGSCFGLKGKDLKNKIQHHLDLMGLSKNADRLVKTYSGGMKRRVNLIAAILHDPELLFLDEPTVGIDVQSRNVITDFLHVLNKKGSTIVYTSHHMKEAESLCSNVAVIDNGIIITQGKPAELIANGKYTSLEQVFLNLTGRELRD